MTTTMPGEVGYAERAAKADSMDMVRGCVLNAIFGVAKRHLPEAVVKSLDPEGLVVRQPFADYPVRLCLAILERAVPAAAAFEGGEDRFLWRVGVDTVESVRESPIGQAAMALRGKPRMLMESFAQSSRPLLVSYGSRSLVWRGDMAARITYHRALLPAPIPAGMYASMLTIIGAVGVQVTYREVGDFTQEFDLTWEGVSA